MLAPVLTTALSGSAYAQGVGTGSIHGKVTDETGGALPGVTVSLASPVLQVQQANDVSDTEGTYRFGNLPPGVYRITYELPGFQTMIREDQRLNVGFAARIDVTMKLGGVEERVTVSGQAPVIDTTHTEGSTNFTKEMLEKIPTSRSMWQVFAMTPGVRVTSTPDVGGSTVGTQQGYSNYGTTGQNKPEIEGINTREGDSSAGFYYDYDAFEEVQVKAVGNDAEMGTPGTNFVGIVKSGGNTFHGTVLASAENKSLQSNNVDDELRSKGVTSGNRLRYYWDTGADLGGRIIRDKLWFYGAYRNQRSVLEKVGYARLPGADGVYGTADDVMGEDRTDLTNQTVKMSYQPAQKYKIIGFVQRNKKRQSERDGTRFRPAENAFDYDFVPIAMKSELQATLNHKTLLTFMVGRDGYAAHYRPVEDLAGKPSRYNRETGFYTGPNENVRYRLRRRLMSTGSLSYFPEDFLGGKHSFKAGYTASLEAFGEERPNLKAGNYLLIYDKVGGVSNTPAEITTYNAPITGIGNRLTEYSGYFKDTWVIRDRLTANLGIRFDWYHSFVDSMTKEQGQFGNAGTFPAVDVRTWKRPAPRAGFAWNIAGNGKTVLKWTYGWFNHTFVSGDEFAATYNRNNRASATYRWRDLDRNNNYTPGEVNLDPNGPDFLSAIGAANNILNPGLIEPVTHELSVGLERELMPNLAARVFYVYKRDVNLYNAVNVLRPLSAWNIPITRRDPGPDGVLGTPDDGGVVTFYDYASA